MYADGNLITTYTAAGNTPNNLALYIGSWPSGGNDWDWMNGRIDDVQIHNVALTQQEIQTAMQGTGGPGVNIPNEPTGLRVSSAGQTTMQLQWQDNSNDETNFQIQKWNALQGTWSTPQNIPPHTGTGIATYTDTGLSSGHWYSYRVRATNNAGNSAWHPTGTAPGNHTYPAAPTSLTVNPVIGTTNALQLQWQDNSYREGFRIEYKDTQTGTYQGLSGATWITYTEGTGIRTYTDTTLKPGQTRWYRIRAQNSENQTAWSNEAQGTTNEAFNFTIQVNPNSGTTEQGTSITTAVTLTRTTGQTGTITLSTPNINENITAEFVPSTITLDSTTPTRTAILTLTPTPTATTRTEQITVQANDESTTKQASYTLDITNTQQLGAPEIITIQPNPVPNTTARDLSIIGKNFSDIIGLLLYGNLLNPLNTVTINETLARYLLEPTQTLPEGTYPIMVINLNLQTSNPRNLNITGSPSTQTTLDTDLDGIPNEEDYCPRTTGRYHPQVGRSGCPAPHYGALTQTTTTNFTNETNLNQIENLRLGIQGIAQIRFTETTSLVQPHPVYLLLGYPRLDPVNLIRDLKIEHNKVFIDSNNIPGLNKEANIEYYNTGITNPVPNKNGIPCTQQECYVITRNNTTNDTTIHVTSWSEYTLTQGTCGDGYCSYTETTTSCQADCGGSNNNNNNNNNGGGGGGPPSSSVTNINLDEESPQTTNAIQGKKLDVQVNEETYRIEITEVTNTEIKLELTNTSKEITLEPLQLYSIDLKNKGREEIEAYTTYNTNIPKITLSKIQTQTIDIGDTQTGNESNKEPTLQIPLPFKPSQTGFWVLLIGILTVILGIYLLYGRTKKKG